MGRKVVLVGSTVTVGQLKDLMEKVQAGVVCYDNLQHFLDNPEEYRPVAGLLERPTRFTAPLGEYESGQDLAAAVKGAGLAYFDPYVVATLLPGVTLCQEKGEAGVIDVNPGDFGNTGPPKFGDYYDNQLPGRGFGRPVREMGALLILKWQCQLDETGDCDLKMGKWFVILSPPLMVYAWDYQDFLCVRRYRDGLHLNYYRRSPRDVVDLDYPCLVSRK